MYNIRKNVVVLHPFFISRGIHVVYLNMFEHDLEKMKKRRADGHGRAEKTVKDKTLHTYFRALIVTDKSITRLFCSLT